MLSYQASTLVFFQHLKLNTTISSPERFNFASKEIKKNSFIEKIFFSAKNNNYILCFQTIIGNITFFIS